MTVPLVSPLPLVIGGQVQALHEPLLMLYKISIRMKSMTSYPSLAYFDPLSNPQQQNQDNYRHSSGTTWSLHWTRFADVQHTTAARACGIEISGRVCQHRPR